MQKKAYKVLAYICEHRPNYMQAHFQDVLETVVAGVRLSFCAFFPECGWHACVNGV